MTKKCPGPLLNRKPGADRGEEDFLGEICDTAIRRNYRNAPGNVLPARLKGLPDSGLDASAAGNFHPDNSDAPDVIQGKNLRKLFTVLHRVKLRAAYEGHTTAHETFVKAGEGIGRAVSGHKKSGAPEKRGRGRNKPDLDRPLCQSTYRRTRGFSGKCSDTVACPDQACSVHGPVFQGRQTSCGR